MIFSRKKVIKILLAVSFQKVLGILLIFSVPFFHNLHIVLPDSILEIPIRYHTKVYYFLWSFEHSFAPSVGFLGCYFLMAQQRKIRSLVGLPIGYEFYKACEKIPFQKEYNIHSEMVTISILFSLCVVFALYLLDLITFNLNHVIRHHTTSLRYLLELKESEMDSETKKEVGGEILNKLEKHLEILDQKI
jgi:hypothetical protein